MTKQQQVKKLLKKPSIFNITQVEQQAKIDAYRLQNFLRDESTVDLTDKEAQKIIDLIEKRSNVK